MDFLVRHDTLEIATRGKGTVEITDAVQRLINGSGVKEGIVTIFIKHTSASLVIMENAKKSGAKWSGTLYNRENGKSYSGTITVKSKDAVDLSGCVAAVLCKTVTWTRIK